MFLFLATLLLIKPESGEFRTKKTLLPNIKAYSLLARGKLNNLSENFTTTSHEIEYQEPPTETPTQLVKTTESNLITAIKSGKTLYWNNFTIESMK